MEEEKKNEVNNEVTEIAETKRRQNFFSRIKTKHNEEAGRTRETATFCRRKQDCRRES